MDPKEFAKQYAMNEFQREGKEVANYGHTVIAGIEIDEDKLAAQAKEHFKTKVMVVDDVDRQIWELVTNVPRIPKPLAFICAFLNLIIPGFGTIVAACMAPNNVSKAQVMIGVMQFLLTFFLVGFIMATYWSYLLVTKAMQEPLLQKGSNAVSPRDGQQRGRIGSGYREFKF